MLINQKKNKNTLSACNFKIINYLNYLESYISTLPYD